MGDSFGDDYDGRAADAGTGAAFISEAAREATTRTALRSPPPLSRKCHRETCFLEAQISCQDNMLYDMSPTRHINVSFKSSICPLVCCVRDMLVNLNK